jgi:hypothetical protein
MIAEVESSEEFRMTLGAMRTSLAAVTTIRYPARPARIRGLTAHLSGLIAQSHFSMFATDVLHSFALELVDGVKHLTMADRPTVMKPLLAVVATLPLLRGEAQEDHEAELERIRDAVLQVVPRFAPHIAPPRFPSPESFDAGSKPPISLADKTPAEVVAEIVAREVDPLDLHHDLSDYLLGRVGGMSGTEFAAAYGACSASLPPVARLRWT